MCVRHMRMLELPTNKTASAGNELRWSYCMNWRTSAPKRRGSGTTGPVAGDVEVAGALDALSDGETRAGCVAAGAEAGAVWATAVHGKGREEESAPAGFDSPRHARVPRVDPSWHCISVRFCGDPRCSKWGVARACLFERLSFLAVLSRFFWTLYRGRRRRGRPAAREHGGAGHDAKCWRSRSPNPGTRVRGLARPLRDGFG